MINLENALRTKYKNRFAETVDSIKDKERLDYCIRWIIENRKGYKGTFEEQKEKFITAYKKRLDKQLNQELLKIENVKKSEEFKRDLIITVEWKASRMWRANPRAYSNYNDFVGDSIGGCGYDKLSTATAQALNNCFPILKLLYQKKENLLKEFLKKNKDKDNENGFNRDVLGYGSGYNILPAFEGGVGVDSHRHIIEGIGLKWECVTSTKTTDVYRIYRGD